MVMRESDVFGFQGQGTHEVGMGAELLEEHPEARGVFDEADEETLRLTGRRISEICVDGPKELLDRHSQLAIFVLSAAAVTVLYKKGRFPKAVTGHSLGEYSALFAAGTFGLRKGIGIIHERQNAMDQANAQINGGGAMIVINGLTEQERQALAKEFDVDVAVINTEDQGVLSGPRNRIDGVGQLLEDRAGVKGRVLDIGGAAHSRWNALAGRIMEGVLKDTEIKKPKYTFFANSARIISDPKELREHLVGMHVDPVRFRDVSTEMARRGMRTFTEVGKRKILSKFIAKTVGDSVAIQPMESLLSETTEKQ